MIALRAMRLAPRGRPLVAPTTGTVDVVGADIIRPVILPQQNHIAQRAITMLFPSEIRKIATQFFGGGRQPAPYDRYPNRNLADG